MIWSGYRTELWRPGILHAPIARVLETADLRGIPITWLPAQPDFCFLADPFGVWRDGRLHVFVEAYDYRDKHGVIRRYTYDAGFNLVGEGLALSARHHLSYPQVIADGSQSYMLPEAHQSGRLTLYRAAAFPDAWEQAGVLREGPVVDASVIHHGGLWWMFHALEGPNRRAMRELHVAFAEHLTGPWTPHSLNPVRTDLASSRPGGTPFVVGGVLHLPVQDCRTAYGAAVNILRIDSLNPKQWNCTPVRTLAADAINSPETDGLHTLSACGDVTLIDVKRIERSPRRALINLQRRWRRLAGPPRGPVR